MDVKKEADNFLLENKDLLEKVPTEVLQDVVTCKKIIFQAYNRYSANGTINDDLLIEGFFHAHTMEDSLRRLGSDLPCNPWDIQVDMDEANRLYDAAGGTYFTNEGSQYAPAESGIANETLYDNCVQNVVLSNFYDIAEEEFKIVVEDLENKYGVQFPKGITDPCFEYKSLPNDVFMLDNLLSENKSAIMNYPFEAASVLAIEQKGICNLIDNYIGREVTVEGLVKSFDLKHISSHRNADVAVGLINKLYTDSYHMYENAKEFYPTVHKMNPAYVPYIEEVQEVIKKQCDNTDKNNLLFIESANLDFINQGSSKDKFWNEKVDACIDRISKRYAGDIAEANNFTDNYTDSYRLGNAVTKVGTKKLLETLHTKGLKNQISFVLDEKTPFLVTKDLAKKIKTAWKNTVRVAVAEINRMKGKEMDLLNVEIANKSYTATLPKQIFDKWEKEKDTFKLEKKEERVKPKSTLRAKSNNQTKEMER